MKMLLSPLFIVVDEKVEFVSCTTKSHLSCSNATPLFTDAADETAHVRRRCWEWQVHQLGDQSPLCDLTWVLSRAPTTDHPLYRRLVCLHAERLEESMMAWEDELDSLGPFPSTGDLRAMLNKAPIAHNETVLFAQGVLDQRSRLLRRRR